MHTLPILAEYLMSWSCSLWRFKFTISWPARLTVCPMAGRFKLRKYRRGDLTWSPPHHNKAQSKVKPTLAVVTILVSGHIDNLIISQSFTTSPGAVVQSEIIFKLFHILSLGLLYLARSDINIHIVGDWQVNISEYKYQYFVEGSVLQQSHCFWTRKQEQNW